MSNPHLTDREYASASGIFARSLQISVDNSNLPNISGVTNNQLLAAQVNQNVADIGSLQSAPAGQRRAINIFDSAVSVDSGNYNTFVGVRNAFVGTSQVDFQPPSEADINGRYPAEIEIENFSDNNSAVRITRPSDFNNAFPNSGIARHSNGTNTFQQSILIPSGFIAFIRKTSDDAVWEVQLSSQDNRAAILQNGTFVRRPQVIDLIEVASGLSITGLTNVSVEAGFAYQVQTTDVFSEPFLGQDISNGDFLVAKVNDPNTVLSSTNDDWLILKDSRNGVVNNDELGFLSEVNPRTESFTERLIKESEVSAVRVFLSSSILTNAPFNSPSQDPSNTEVNGFRGYYGGDEDRGSDNDFTFNRDLPFRYMYVDIDGTFDRYSEVFVHVVRNGSQLFSFNLDDSFDPVTLTGSSDTYFVLDTNDADPNPDLFNYQSGDVIEVVLQGQRRAYRTSENIDVTDSIPNDSITRDELTQSVRDELDRATQQPTIPQIDPKLQAFADHIALTQSESSGWREMTPSPIAPFNFSREYKFLDGVASSEGLNDQFNDIDGSRVVGVTPHYIFSWDETNRHNNTNLPGVDTYVENHPFTVENKAPVNSISDRNRKIGAFSYGNQRDLSGDSSDTTVDVLRFGSSNPPLIGFSRDEGLFVYEARGGSETRTRTYDERVSLNPSRVTTAVPVEDLRDIVINVPNNLRNGEAIRVVGQGLLGGVDEGQQSQRFVIANIESDQSFGTRSYTYNGLVFNFVVSYDASENQIVMEPDHSISSSELEIQFTAYHEITEQWGVGTTSFVRRPINPIIAHDSHDNFDASMWQLENRRVNLVWSIQDYRLNDTDSDPEQMLSVMVQLENQTPRFYSFRLYRPASQFTWTEIIHSNFQFAMGNVIGYRFSSHNEVQLSQANMQFLIDNFEQNLGLANDRVNLIELLKANFNLEMEAGHSIIMTTTDTNVRREVTLTSGGWSFSDTSE